jgi:DNA-binding Xre family transcriptional regulator
MERFKIKQSEVAPHIGVSQSQLSKMLNGKRAIDLDQLEGMCEMLELRVQEVTAEVEDYLRDRDFGYSYPYLVVDGERVSGASDTEPPVLTRDQEQELRKSDVDLTAKEGERK